MATCCPGVTECDHLITIGFLNTFIGSDIQDSSGNSVTAAGDSTYCPTYKELTGGTLIQNWKEGTTPNGDVDGIVIDGVYSEDECVRRDDLSMKYTRFKSLDVDASSLEIDACSGCSTLSFTHLYNRYTRELNSSCEAAKASSVVEASDTASGEVTYSSSNNVFSITNNKVCVGKNNPSNNGRSSSRNTTITAKITFRGTNHTDTVVITQAGLTGEYKYWYHTYSVHGKGVSCSGGPSFGCSGGRYSATAYYYQDDWDVYRWKDKCGTDYDSDTVQRNRVNDQYKVYDTYGGSFPDNTTTGGPAKSDSKSWDGYGSCSWTQSYCPPPACPTCTCDDCDCLTWGYGTYSGTVGCTGGRVYINNVTIPGTAITYTYDEESSACTITTAATSETRSTYVNIACNTGNTQQTYTGTKNNISYTIKQDAGPCCSTSYTITYETVTLSCDAHISEDVSARYTAATVDTCCNTSYTYGTEGPYKVNIGCNSGATRTLSDEQKSNAPFVVEQLGEATCCGCGAETTTYTYADVSVDCSAHTSESMSVSYTAYTTYEVEECTPTSADGTTSITINVECNDTSSVKDYTVAGPLGGTVTIHQAAGPCCECLNPVASITWNNASGTAEACDTSKSVGITGVKTTTYDNCSAETESVSGTATVTFSENNTSSAKSLSFDESVSGYNAHITIEQSAGPCKCLNPVTSITWNNASGTAEACDTTKTVTVTGDKTTTYDNCSAETESVSGTATVTFSENNTSSAKSLSFDESVSGYNAHITIEQSAGPCKCLNPVTSITWNNASGTAEACDTTKTVTVTGDKITAYDNCPSSAEPLSTTVTVTFTENNTSQARTLPFDESISGYNAHITVEQSGGPCECLNPSTYYKYEDVTIPCSEADSTTLSVTYSAVTTYSNCPDVVETGTSEVYISAVTCNSGSSIVLQSGSTGNTLEAASPKITQQGGCTCCECEITASAGSSISKDGGSNLTLGTYSATSCVTNVGATSNQSWITSLSASGGQVKGTVAANAYTSSRTANITVTGKSGSDNCSSGFTITQEANVCVPGTTYYLSSVTTTIDCIGSDHFKGDLCQETTSIVDDECKTESTLIAGDKNIWIDPVPCNTSGSDKHTTYYVYYVGTRLCGFTSTQSSGIYIDSYSITQPSCEGCTRGSDSVSVPVEWQEGRTCGDGNRCGFDFTKCDVTGGGNFVSLTAKTSNSLSFKTLSANLARVSRTETFTITPTGATQTPTCCYSSFCDSWTLSIVQNPVSGCGCANVDMINSALELAGTAGSNGTSKYQVTGGCVLDDDTYDGYWVGAFESTTRVSPPSWLSLSADWNTTDGTLTFTATQANTGAARTAWYYLNLPVAGEWSDCKHWIEITQLPMT